MICLPRSYAAGRRSSCMRREIKKSRVRTLEEAGGAFCFAGGILAALLGSLLTASGWITGVEIHPWIHAAGTALLVLTIPLILFAGFCLDWAERSSNRASDNDRDLGPAKSSPDPVMISKQIKRGVEVTQNRKSVSLDKLPKAHPKHSRSENSEKVESVRGLVGKQNKQRV